MNKCDVTITKKMTINTGNYSSIQPSVSITLKDVYVEDIEKTYKNIEVITSALFFEEISSLSDLQNDFKTYGFNEIISKTNVVEMKKDLKESIKEISGISKF